jgi:hypothetical protein
VQRTRGVPAAQSSLCAPTSVGPTQCHHEARLLSKSHAPVGPRMVLPVRSGLSQWLSTRSRPSCHMQHNRTTAPGPREPRHDGSWDPLAPIEDLVPVRDPNSPGHRWTRPSGRVVNCHLGHLPESKLATPPQDCGGGWVKSSGSPSGRFQVAALPCTTIGRTLSSVYAELVWFH